MPALEDYAGGLPHTKGQSEGITDIRTVLI